MNWIHIWADTLDFSDHQITKSIFFSCTGNAE